MNYTVDEEISVVATPENKNDRRREMKFGSN